MNIKHQEIIIDSKAPFANCKLGREKYASILIDIVSYYSNGFVLAINSEWGTGKTTFVKMWECLLQNKEFKTLYFNAWENDFEDNPLVALIAEFKALTDKKNGKYKSLLKKGAIFTKNLAPELIKSIVENYKFAKTVSDTVENATKGATEILEDEINEYTKKKEGIKDFRKALKDFVESIENKKPIVFIIDELDRCRPNYSVTLLEQIKHLFSVPGIVFVLSIDKEQLGNAVRGVYGSDRINADEYLRRFIDLEYSIPIPDTKIFVRYLYSYFEFGRTLLSDRRKGVREFWYEPDNLIDLATILFEKSNLSLRQQEKIFAHARIALLSLEWNQYLFPTLFIFLIYLKNHHPSIYKKIELKSIKPKELIEEFAKIFPKSIEKEDDLRLVIHLEALLGYLYYSYYFENARHFRLLTQGKEGEKEIIDIKSHFDNTEGQDEFVRNIKSFIDKWDYRGISIRHVLDKINLVQNIIA